MEGNGEFPLKRWGSESSLKSSVSTISSFSYGSTDRTIEAKSHHGSSRRSHVSDVESILDDLDMCQEELSVDPDVNEEIPIDTESRALTLDKKSINIPRRVNGHSYGRESWEHGDVKAKSPVIGKTSYSYPTYFRDYSDSVDSETGLMSTSALNDERKTPGSINSMQRRVNRVKHTPHERDRFTNGVDWSPQMRRGKLGRGTPSQEAELNLSRDHKPSPHRLRSVSFESAVDDIDFVDVDYQGDLPSGSKLRSNDVETFHAVIQNTQLRGPRRDVYTRGNKANLSKTYSRSDETLLSVGSSPARTVHESREIFSMDMDMDTKSVLSDGPRGVRMKDGKSGVTKRPYGMGNDGRRKLIADHIASLKNLQASAC